MKTSSERAYNVMRIFKTGLSACRIIFFGQIQKKFGSFK
jgi:hypothetical protein